MRKNTFLLFLLFTVMMLGTIRSYAQDSFGPWSHTVPVKDYEGRSFRLQASVRTEIEDDSASARLWVRIDKEKGMGFFDNMWKRPIRNKEWKTYTIEGKIDSGAKQLAFGGLCQWNGKFYFDNFKLEIGSGKNWQTIYSTDFENGMEGWNAGIGMDSRGVNSTFSATTADVGSNNHALLIEGKNVPNYGNNKKAGNFAEVNGIKLYYEIYGEGQPLVLLHGNGGSIAGFSGFMNELSKQYKVIGIDNRSQGRSTDTDKPLTYDQMASDVNALLEQLHIDSVLIWGQSDGAIMGMLLAKDYPKKVKKVLAYGANMQPDSLAVYGWAVDWVKATASTSKDPKEVKLYALMRDYPNVPYQDLHKIKAPVLIMGGDRDVIRPEHLVKMFQNIPNSQLCILPGATHGGSHEKKELFLKIMHDFFDKPFSMPDTKDWLK